MICREALKYAELNGYDTVLLDTAGRLHIDAPLMEELSRIKAAVDPGEILLVADAMTGQDAVNVAKAFHEKLTLTGVVLTKADGDARGGAALSIRAVTGAPVKFVGTGEKLDALEPFHPERMASRILGMGDILTFVEKAQDQVDEKQAKELERKLRKNEFTLEDFRDQLLRLKKMGSMEEILGMIPGLGAKAKELKGMAPDETELDAGRRHHRLDDAAGAAKRADPQRQPPEADRRGERNDRAGREPPDEEFPAGGGDDPADDEGRDARHGEEPPLFGRPGEPAESAGGGE